jgi:hypothetical protein
MEMLWSHLVRRGVAQSRESRHPVGRHDWIRRLSRLR